MKGVDSFSSLLASSTAVVSCLAAIASGDCISTLPGSYTSAVATYPALKTQIELVAQQQLAQWYTDRVADTASLAAKVVQSQCSSSSSLAAASRPTVVVYGLPQKDCEHHFSSSGSNTDTASYRSFLQQLADAAGTKEIIYILEPDAVGLLADDGCGTSNGYAENLAVAIEVLTANENADLYLDIGYWTLSDEAKAAKVVDVVKAVDKAGKCRGIALNTSNYRSAAEMEQLCARFARVAGADYRCIVDSSRNGVAPSGSEWCNVKSAGMGELPTALTGYDHIDYFVWVKPPGESDGECSGQSEDAMAGPSAGTFFPDHFVQLWNDGVFVQSLGQARITTGSDYSAYVTASSVASEYESAKAAEAPTGETGASGSVETEETESEAAFTTFAVLDDGSSAADVHAASEGSEDDEVEETEASNAMVVVATTPAATNSTVVATTANTTSTLDASDADTTQDTERVEAVKQTETRTAC